VTITTASIRPLRVAAAAALAALALGVPSSSAQQQPGGGIRVKQVAAMDNNGFDRPLPAFSLMVPFDWKTEGGVVWARDPCNAMGYNFAFEASSPDRAFGVSVLPTASWSAYYGMPAPQSGCAQADIRSADAFLQWYVPRLVPGARLLDYRPRPDLLKEAGVSASQTALGGGAYTETAADAGEVLVAFESEGRQLRGSVAAVIVLWHSHFPGSPSMMAGVPGTPDMDVFGGSSLPAFGAFAPDGALDLRTAELIRKSIVPGAEWSRRIAEHRAVINRQNRQTATNIGNIQAQTSREIGDMISKGYRDRSAVQDRMHRESVEAIRGVETYDDPYNGGTVQLDNTYDHAWQLNDGSYVLTDDPSFNPHATLGQDGQELTPTQ